MQFKALYRESFIQNIGNAFMLTAKNSVFKALLPALGCLLAGCAIAEEHKPPLSYSHQDQKKTAIKQNTIKQQPPTISRGVQMPTLSPIFNEILASAKGIAPGAHDNVNPIVSKYIPIGTSRKQVQTILSQMSHHYTEKEKNIHTGYKGNNPPLTPNPAISITFHFDESDMLEAIDAKYIYLQ